MRGLCSALALCALIIDVTASLKHPSLRDISRRNQAKVNKVVHEATHERLFARYANSTTNDTSRYLTNATASQSISFVPHAIPMTHNLQNTR